MIFGLLKSTMVTFIKKQMSTGNGKQAGRWGNTSLMRRKWFAWWAKAILSCFCVLLLLCSLLMEAAGWMQRYTGAVCSHSLKYIKTIGQHFINQQDNNPLNLGHKVLKSQLLTVFFLYWCKLTQTKAETWNFYVVSILLFQTWCVEAQSLMKKRVMVQTQ